MRPLVSAEWHPVGATNVGKQTVVHVAQSDEFTLHLGPTNPPPQGSASLWLIYADFMGGTVPGNWPKDPEYNGGIVAFFEFAWRPGSDGSPSLTLRQTAPARGSGFHWEGWTLRTLATQPSTSTARLTEAPQ